MRFLSLVLVKKILLLTIVFSFATAAIVRAASNMGNEQEAISENEAAYLFFPNNPHPAIDINVLTIFTRTAVWGPFGYFNFNKADFFDVRTNQIIDINKITLSRGEELLLRLPPGHIGGYDGNAYKIVWDSYNPIGAAFSNTVLYKKSAAWWYGSDSFGWEMWANVSRHGPWFLFHAMQIGVTSFNIYFGEIIYEYDSKGKQTGSHIQQGDLIGHFIVTVVP